MTILSSLAKAYERLPNAPPFGYSAQGILYCLVINANGEVIGPPVSLSSDKKGKPIPRAMNVPYFGGRSGSSPPPYFLWDNSAYVLGKSAKGFDAGKRFDAFKEYHLIALQSAQSPSLKAFVRFLNSWDQSNFEIMDFPEEILDRNIVFRFADELKFIHEGDEANNIWNKIFEPDVSGEGVCLVSGEREKIARLHPPISTFDNPARIVSFDKDNDAFSSYGHVQAENAPTSAKSAFAYTAVLNRFLSRDSGHRLQIGDASTVFWADASKLAAVEDAEAMFPAFFDAVDDMRQEEKIGTKRIHERLEQIRKGIPLEEVEPDLGDVQFYVLGLAPNAARLSVRFFYSGSFGELTRHYQKFVADMRIEPPWRDPFPPLWRYLRETAVLGKSENVAPNLAGEWMRAILSGTYYPLTLLSSVLTRIRAGDDINALRAGILKAVLIRNFWSLVADEQHSISKEEALMALEADNPDPAYVLGRLFAVLEKLQLLALGRLSASIRDRYYGAASASPRTVFPLLFKLNQHHRSKAEKDDSKRGLAIHLSRQIGEIVNLLPAELPASLSLASQGKFAIGYYHQFNFRKSDDTTSEEGDVA